MAKKRQTRIIGTYDEDVQEVMTVAQDYVDLLYERMKTQEKENVARDALVASMHEHNVESCELDGYTVKLEHIEQDKVKVKSKAVEEE